MTRNTKEVMKYLFLSTSVTPISKEYMKGYIQGLEDAGILNTNEVATLRNWITCLPIDSHHAVELHLIKGFRTQPSAH